MQCKSLVGSLKVRIKILEITEALNIVGLKKIRKVGVLGTFCCFVFVRGIWTKSNLGYPSCGRNKSPNLMEVSEINEYSNRSVTSKKLCKTLSNLSLFRESKITATPPTSIFF